MISLGEYRFIKGLDPVADAFEGTTGTQRSDVINVSGFHKLLFLIIKGVGTTGTSTVTVSACDNVTPTTEVAVPFTYQKCTDPDAPGAVTAVAATGFATTAGSSDLYAVEVDMKALASTGYKYCCLKMVQVVDSPIVGAIVAMGVPRYVNSSAAVTT